MRTGLIILTISILLTGCWICPDPNHVEFDRTNQVIEVLSENYFIKSVTITEYIQKDGYIELIESNRLILEQDGARGAYILNLPSPGENYQAKGKEYFELLKSEFLQYEILLMKFENKKDGNGFNEDVITFVSSEIKDEKTKFGSKHPCP